MADARSCFLSQVRVSEHIPQVLALIETLSELCYAYEVASGPNHSGGLFFDTERFEPYGKLEPAQAASSSSAQGEEGGDEGGNEGGDERESEGQEGAEGVVGAGGKRCERDFALWKLDDAASDGTTGAGWESRWGRGRPGWHIECRHVNIHNDRSRCC